MGTIPSQPPFTTLPSQSPYTAVPQNMQPVDMHPAMNAFSQSKEFQRQMTGEKLYPMVLSSRHLTFSTDKDYLAQRITGMLLELPQNELMRVFTYPEELRMRVKESLEVLKEDG